ncbi:hypothetical protein FNF28_05171 [Cafeteria roenbergensis]|uniref:Uncharacterized protein n=1 Tax=Cafeteria roenbergensis TaxID=33653 RepID=A0A5A8D6Z6_CAFRO|nr:hypothetical protein FNF28_05171 [Cafeteria roenbergensis]
MAAMKRFEAAQRLRDANDRRLIRIGWEHDADSIKKIPATRCTKANLDRIFETDIRFLFDQHGEVLHPHQFAEKLQVAPYCYFIKPWESPHRFDDALFDTTYLGGTALLIVNVPHGLTEEDLRAWFRAGLVGGDVEVIEITKKIQRTERRLNTLRGNMRELERQMEEAGALLQEDASAAGSGSAASVVSRAQQSQVAQVVGESLVVGGAGRGRGAGGEAPALGGELQDRVDRLRAMVAELERGTLPQLLDARSELLDTAAAMDVRMLRVAEQSAWEAMAAARWDGADVTNQERRQRLRFTGGGVLAFASGEAGGRGKRGRRRRERAKGPFRARVVGAAGVPPTDEEADDELAEKLAADPSGEMMGGPASTFAGGLTSRSASTAAARRADDSGGGATTARSAYMESGQRWEAPDDDGMSSDDSASSDDDPAARGGGATARAGAAKRRAAKDARDAAAMETTGVRRRHVWQLFLPSDSDGSVAMAALAFREWERVRLFVPRDRGVIRKQNRFEMTEEQEREQRDPLAQHRRLLSSRLQEQGLEDAETRRRSFAYYQKRGAVEDEFDDDFGAGMPSHIPPTAAVMGGEEDDGTGGVAVGMVVEGAPTARSGLTTSRAGGPPRFVASLDGMREASMREANIVRVRHGQGVFKDDELGSVYSGRFFLGHKSGRAVEVGADGTYAGAFRFGVRWGLASHRLPSGDLYQGRFSPPQRLFERGEGDFAAVRMAVRRMQADGDKSAGASAGDGLGIDAEMQSAMAGVEAQVGADASKNPAELRRLKMEARNRARREAKGTANLKRGLGALGRHPGARAGVWLSEQDLGARNPYRDGQMSDATGAARIRFADGSEYVGQVLDGRVTGQGKYSTPDGQTLEGAFEDGLLHGEGARTTRDGVVERGTWRRGELHGRGVQMWGGRGGDTFVGSFRHGARWGSGRLITRAGTAVYDGSFQAGMRDGRGSQSWRWTARMRRR